MRAPLPPVVCIQLHAVQVELDVLGCFSCSTYAGERGEGDDRRDEATARSPGAPWPHGGLAEARPPDAVDEGAEQRERQDDGDQREVRCGEELSIGPPGGGLCEINGSVLDSVLQKVGVVGTNGALEAEERQHDGEAHGDLGGLGGDDEEREHLAGAWYRPGRGAVEGDEREVRPR